MSEPKTKIGAIVLAAGLSKRMGQPKMLLPWAGKTVIETVVLELLQGGIIQPVVVVGAAYEQISRLLEVYPVQVVFNPSYNDEEMLHSLQAGLRVLINDLEAVLIVLGDQPQIQSSTIRLMIDEYHRLDQPLIIPSYKMRRGHPWLVRRALWEELMALHAPVTLRDFIQHHALEINYVNVDDPSILADLDTPEDYQKYQPA